MDEIIKELVPCLEAMGLAGPEHLLQKLACHWQLLSKANACFNLTAITQPEAAAPKHYADCLAAAEALKKLLPQGGKVADIGSGGGFPGLVMAAACPETDFTLIESSRKKTDFLKETASAMGLTGVRALPLRAEEAGRDASLRESFDLVTARAVAELAVLAEYSFPLLKTGGVFFAMKGPDPTEELAAAANALSLLGGECEQILHYELPCGESRSLLIIRKKQATPDKYPRRPGMPAKRPL